jgi:hypothetical protein
MDPTQKLLDLSQSLWLDNITNSLEGSSTAAASADYWLRQFARHSYFGASPAAVNAIQKTPPFPSGCWQTFRIEGGGSMSFISDWKPGPVFS